MLEMLPSRYLGSTLVLLQRGDLPVPPAFCGSVSLLLLLHLTHQCHLVQESSTAEEIQNCNKTRRSGKKRRRNHDVSVYLGLFHLSHVQLEFLELLLVLRLVLQQAGMLLLS